MLANSNALEINRLEVLAADKPDNEVQHDGENQADQEAGHDGKEEAKVALLYRDISGKVSQERNSVPKNKQQTDDDNKDTDKYHDSTEDIKTRHT